MAGWSDILFTGDMDPEPPTPTPNPNPNVQIVFTNTWIVPIMSERQLRDRGIWFVDDNNKYRF